MDALSNVYGPLFIKEGWVLPRIRLFNKTEFIAGSANNNNNDNNNPFI